MTDARARTGSQHSLANTGRLIRLILRRDRIRIPIWIVSILIVMVGGVNAIETQYATDADRQARAALMENPAAILLSGPGHGLENYTIGAIVANEWLSFMAVIVALMSITLMVRHTRADEEAGRTELLRANVTGRFASLAAALIVVMATNLLLGLLTGLGIASLSIESVTFSGSMLFGASLAAVGIVFAGVTAIAVQLSEYGRGALGLSAAALGIVYVLRAVGDAVFAPLSWLSPIGWAQATRVYVDDRWWPLALAVIAAAVCSAVAFVFSTRRDLGAGLLPPKPGPPAASPFLVRPLGFAFRLHRTSLIAWTVVLLISGLLYGALAGEIETFLEDAPNLQELFVEAGEGVTDGFMAVFLAILAMTVAVFALQATLRIRNEESAGHAESVLSTALSRWKWAGTHLAIAIAGSTAMLMIAAISFGGLAAIALDDSNLFWQVIGGSLVYFVSIWSLVGLGMALIGVAPRLASIAWLVLGYAFVVEVFAGLFNLPDWTGRLSPFGYVPNLPADSFSIVPVAVLTGIAATLLIAGLLTFQRRDIQMN